MILRAKQMNIDFGVENEVFYLAIDNKKELPNQDQKIREKVTSDYLHQFSMLINNKLSVIDASKIEIKLDKLVEEIDKQIFNAMLNCPEQINCSIKKRMKWLHVSRL